MGTLKAAALILTVRAAIIGGPGAVWPTVPADQGQLTPDWQLHSRFGDSFFMPAIPWQITGDMVQFDARSGLTVITGPSEETVRALVPEQATKATSSTQTDGPQAGRLSPVEMDIPTTEAGRTAYLEEVEPGLYRRKDLAETAGYGIRVSASPDGDKASLCIDLSYQELADGRFEQALGAYVSRPAVTRKETQFQCSQPVPTTMLLVWQVPGLPNPADVEIDLFGGVSPAGGVRPVLRPAGAGAAVGGGLRAAASTWGADRPSAPQQSITLSLRDVALQDVVRYLEEAFPGQKVALADAALGATVVQSLKLAGSGLPGALKAICQALGLQYAREGNAWTIRRGRVPLDLSCSYLIGDLRPRLAVLVDLRPRLAVLVDLRPADGAGDTPVVHDTAYPTAPGEMPGGQPPVAVGPVATPSGAVPTTAGDAPTGAPRVPDSPTAPQPQPITDDPELAQAKLKELETDLEAAKIRLEQAKRRAEEGKVRAEAATITTSEAADLQEAYDLAKVDLAKVEAQIATQQIVLKRAQAAQNREVTVVIAGEVKAPGAYTLPPGSTVVDLIRKAGGLTEKGDASHVSLIRSARGPAAEELNLAAWLAPAGGAPAPPEPEKLMPGDVVVVPRRAADNEDAKLIEGLSAVQAGEAVAVTYILGTDAAVSGDVRTISGRTVARLAGDASQTPGAHALTWSGRTQFGTLVPSGRYIVVLTARTDAGREQRAAVLAKVTREQ